MNYDKLAQSLALEVLGSTDVEAHDKVAIKPETEKFVEWCIMKNDRVSQRECATFLERQGVPHKEYKPSKRGQPLARGEMVRIDKRKVPGHLQDLLGPLHDAVATIDEVDGEDVILNFEDPRLPNILRVEGGTKGSKVGLYRHTPAAAATSNGEPGEDGDRSRASKIFEVVYFSKKGGPPPSADNLKLVQDYVDRGSDKGEERSRIYYTGLVLKTQDAKSGAVKDWYFSLFPQQRATYPRSMNPTTGQVLYLGRLRKRPSGWEKEYDEWVMAAATEEEGE